MSALNFGKSPQAFKNVLKRKLVTNGVMLCRVLQNNPISFVLTFFFAFFVFVIVVVVVVFLMILL